MKILSIVDSFKNSLTSLEISKLLQEEALKRNINLDYLPISDGGDGFLDVISFIIPGEFIKVSFTGFDGNLYEDSYYVANDIAYIEVARFIGLHLTNKIKKDPKSYGTISLGKVIKDVYQRGIRKIVVGLGGTATNDFGMGMLSELGFNFINNSKITPNMSPRRFNESTQVVVSDEFIYRDLNFTIISDVKNELFGLEGATYTFGSQKGIKNHELAHIETIGKDFSKKIIDLGYNDTTKLPGAGAAGGLGFALTSVFKAKINSGINFILDLIDFDLLQNKYDIIITGEGKIDRQSLQGKVVFEIASRTLKNVVLICAINDLRIDEIPKSLNNIVKIESIVPKLASQEESLKNPRKYIRILAKKIFDEI